MGIYVDGLQKTPTTKRWPYAEASHLVADSLEELLEFGKSIGLKESYLHHRVTMNHFDVTGPMREKAVKAGAIEITAQQLMLMMKKEREALHMVNTNTSLDFMELPEHPIHQSDAAKAGVVEVIPKAEALPTLTEIPTSESGMPVLAFDTETELISYEKPIPPLVCMTYADAGGLKGAIKTPWENDIQQQLIDSFTAGQHSVGHNVSFDLSILAFKYPDLLPYIFDALERDLIHDTLLREKLLMLTLYGNFEMIELNGCNVRLSYTLDALEKKYLNIDRSDLKNDEDAPRLNYAEYINVPAAEWPEDYRSYAIDDSINTGLIYAEQEKARQRCIETTGYDPFAVETFRVRISFALRLLECVGDRMDPEEVLKVAERFRTEYAQPRLRNPLLATGLLTDIIPARPYANGALDHTEACNLTKHTSDGKVARKAKTCGCLPKMKAAEPEHNPQKPLFQYIWNLAHTNPNFKAWPSDATISALKKAEVYKDAIKDKAFKTEIIAGTGIDAGIKNLEADLTLALSANDKKTIKAIEEKLVFADTCKKAGHTVLIPDDIKLTVNEEWSSTFSALDPILMIWAERKALRKIITDYLPKMFYTDENGVETPAAIVRGGFYPLCLTGRSSSSASKFYPSRNQQNVDPRVRPCTIPRDGNVINSSDYSGMELATLAQKCINLFGHSVLADKINAGIDTHAYLAAQIATAVDEYYGNLLQNNGVTSKDATYDDFILRKTYKEPCESAIFCENFKAKYRQEKSKDLDRPVLWSDFFKYFRLLAKPTGLGFPGGLAAATMVAYAKGTYKVELSIEMCVKLRNIWLETYPEMGPYLEHINKHCQDPNHAPEEYEDDDGKTKKRVFYTYDTPRGMHRAKCGYCEAANGAGLQAFSAEGALDGLYDAQKATWLAGYDGPLDSISNFLDTVDPNGILSGAFLINFVHDENVWEGPEDGKNGQRARIIEKIMVDAMEKLTPDVRAAAETACMRRWNKYAEPIWTEDGDLVPWIPEPEKVGVWS